ncbi:MULTISPECIES: EAL domain-containing protein [unclassified Phyllobacterium]|uniref:EAL domain-containing protein n=1 Tax=unclassified Phyllobacterium TaxID=2638441 RepID=UPI0008F428A7|nr:MULTISPECIES: EAL domain-containing protein [unclassified Phyllobacterium]SFI61044.1 sensor c-di-GMP phosphodiesterase, contains CSS-motif sensor and EAL domain [Phyllobacterium sp. CL33Tsu]
MKYIVRLLDKSAITACLLAGAATTALAMMGARSIALSLAQSDVAEYAGNLLKRAEGIALETNNALAEANHVEGEPCGSTDLDNMRRIAFTARYIKDVGRVNDQKLMCSSYLGVVTPPFVNPPPDIITEDGHKIWGNASLRLADGVTALVIEAGNANVVTDPSAFLDLVRYPYRYSVAIIDPEKGHVLRSWGQPVVDESILVARKDTSTDTATDIIHIDCSKVYFLCSVAALNKREAIARQSTFILGFGALGFLLGGFLTLVGFLLYRTQKPLAARLKDALRSNELSLMFQPIVDLRSGRMVSAEALVRWTDRQGNNIPPDIFVAEAEAHGTAGEITTYVLKEVGRTAKFLLSEHRDFVITVNIVASDLSDPNFYATLDQTISLFGIHRNQIGLELTERSTAHLDIAVPAIARLQQLGHPVYLDDFGTGYSSLAHLQELKVNVIKLDRAFTNSVGTESVKVSIVPQILGMANSLGLGVVVEGIETEAQYSFFASASPHCCGQGWLISRPMPFDRLISFKADH